MSDTTGRQPEAAVLSAREGAPPFALVAPKPGMTLAQCVGATLGGRRDATPPLAFVDFPDTTPEPELRAGRVLSLVVNGDGNTLGLPVNRSATAYVHAFSEGKLTWQIVGSAVLVMTDRETREISPLAGEMVELMGMFQELSGLLGILGSLGNGAQGQDGPDPFGFPLSPN